jgi:hypothetical protein
MKISSFNSLGCYDLILQINLPLPLVLDRLKEYGFKQGDNFLVWENPGHRVEDYPNYLGTLIRTSVHYCRDKAFAGFVTDVTMDEDKFDPEDYPDLPGDV